MGQRGSNFLRLTLSSCFPYAILPAQVGSQPLSALCFRAYPEGFGKRLLECFEGRRGLPGHMRHKYPVSMSLSDKELFDQMEILDPWVDASMCECWKYLYNNKYLKIPDSWSSTMAKFDKDLTNLVPWLQVKNTCSTAAFRIYMLLLDLRYVCQNVKGRNSIVPASNLMF